MIKIHSKNYVLVKFFFFLPKYSKQNFFIQRNLSKLNTGNKLQSIILFQLNFKQSQNVGNLLIYLTSTSINC